MVVSGWHDKNQWFTGGWPDNVSLIMLARRFFC